MTQQMFREQFPELEEKVYGKQLVYLDNAATSLRPLCVLEKWEEMSVKKNSNLHRAVHHIAEIATKEYEQTREFVASFLGADKSEIIFTSGTTQAVNLVAFSFGERFIGKGDEIIVAESEHHSNLVPWQMLSERKGAVIKVLPVDENGRLEIEKLDGMISDATKLVCVAHISNVLGLVNPVKDIIKICHSRNCPVLVDGAQGIVHAPVNVKDLDCDFYVFSGHKVYAAPGTGVLFGKKKWLEQMPPYMGGGEMIETVKWSGTSYAPIPQKFEAGTQNISGTPTLTPALETLRLSRTEELCVQGEQVKGFIYDKLLSHNNLRMFGQVDDLSLKAPVFSFVVNGVHHEDLALVLDKMGVAVRSGQMCAEPLMDRYGVMGMTRASFAPYNTMDDAECFIESLDRAIAMLR